MKDTLAMTKEKNFGNNVELKVGGGKGTTKREREQYD